MAYIGMGPYVVMAYMAIAYVVMAYVVMAYVVMAYSGVLMRVGMQTTDGMIHNKEDAVVRFKGNNTTWTDDELRSFLLYGAQRHIV